MLGCVCVCVCVPSPILFTPLASGRARDLLTPAWRGGFAFAFFRPPPLHSRIETRFARSKKEKKKR